MRNKSLRDTARTPVWDGPSDRVRCGGEHQGDSRTQRAIQAQKRMRGETGKECACARAAEMMRGQPLRRLKPRHAELRHQERMMRDSNQGAEAVPRELFPMIDERLHESAPGFGVCAQCPVHVGE